MKHNTLKIISFALALCMIFSIMPGVVSAQGIAPQVGAAESNPLQENAAQNNQPQSSRTQTEPVMDLSLENYLKQQLDGMTLKLGENDIMKAFGLPLPITPSKPVSGDVLSLTGGSPGAQGQYVINGGIYDTTTRFGLTITRPMGAAADYPASVDLHGIGSYYDSHAQLFDSPSGGTQISSITFAPGETSKTVYLEYMATSTTTDGTKGTEPFFVMLSNPYRAKPEYTLIEVDFARNETDLYNDSYDISSLTAIVTIGVMNPGGGTYDVGDIVPIGVLFSAWVDITASTTLTMSYSDSTSVTLSPIQTGTTGKVATYLYTVSEKDILDGDLAVPVSLTNATVTNIGTYDFYVGSTGGPYPLNSNMYGFSLLAHPKYGTMTMDKSVYNGLETATLTIPLLNASLLSPFPTEYPLDANLTDWFKISLDGGGSFVDDTGISYSGGAITATFRTPVSIGVEAEYSAEIFELTQESSLTVATAIPGRYASFKVKALEGFIPVTSMQITGLPESNVIFLDAQDSFQLGCDVMPANASFTTYTCSSSNPAVASIDNNGLLTALSVGNTTITVTSDEVSYHELMGGTPDYGKLSHSVNIRVGTKIIPNMVIDIRPYEPSGEYVDVLIYHNFDSMASPPNTIYYDIYDSSGTIISALSDSVPAFPSVYSSGFVYFRIEELPEVFSTYVSGEYKPAYTVKFTAEDGFGTPIEQESAIYIYPPTPSITFPSLYSIFGLYLTTKQVGIAPMDLPVKISNLDKSAFSVRYEIFKNNVLLEGPFVATQLDSSPLGLSRTDSGSRANLAGTIHFEPEPVASMDLSDNYEIRFSASNGSQTANLTVPIQIVNDSPSASQLTLTSRDVLGTPTTVYSDDTITGPSLTDIAAVTEADETSYSSEAAYKLLLQAAPSRELNLVYPAIWGAPTLSIGNISLVGEQYGTSINSSSSFRVNYPTDKNTPVTLKWSGIDATANLTYAQESFRDKIYAFSFPYPVPNETMRLTYTNGKGLPQTRVTTPYQITTSSGGYTLEAVIYEPDGIAGGVQISYERLEGTLIKLYTTYIDNPVSAVYPSEIGASWLAGSTGPAYFRNTLSRAFSDAPYVDVSFIGKNNEAISGSISVDYHIIDSNFGTVTYIDSDLLTSYGETIPAGDGIKIDYRPILENPDSLIMLEVTAPGYKPEVFFIDATYLKEATGGKRVNVSIKLVLDTKESDPVSISNPILTYYEEKAGTTQTVTVNLLSVLSGNTVVYPTEIDPGLEVLLLLEKPEQASVDFVLNNFLISDGLRSAKPAAAVLIDNSGSLTFLKNTYAKLTFNLSSAFPEDTTVKAELKWNGAAGGAQLPYLRRLDKEMKQVQEIMDELEFAAPGNTDIKEATNKLDFSGGDSDVKNSLLAFEIDLSNVDELPFDFLISRLGNEFIVRGVLSKNFIPGGELAGDIGELLDKAKDFEEYFNKMVDIVKDYADGGDKPRSDQSGIEAFVGFRGYILGKAVFNQNTNSFTVSILEGGLIAEISGKYSNRISCLICEFGFSVEGKLSSTLAITGPDGFLPPPEAPIKANFVITNHLSVGLSANVGIGFSIFVLDAYVGVKGRGSASHDEMIVYRPYLDGGMYGLQAGFKTELSASLVIYASSDVLFMNWYYEEWPLVKASTAFYSPEDQTNPYIRMQNAGSSVLGAATAGRSVYPDAFADGLRGSAGARFYNKGDNIAYRFIDDPNDYEDDRIMVSGVSSHSPDALSDETAYGFDLSTSGTKAVAAWETLDSPPEQDALFGIDLWGALASYYAESEIMVSLYNGSTWSAAKELSDNSYADMSPVTAANGTNAAVVWTRGDFVVNSDINGIDMYMDGEMVCRLYDNALNVWGDPIRLLTVSDTIRLTGYNAAMDDDGNVVVAAAVLNKDTDTSTVYLIHISAAGGTVTVQDMGADGAAPQVIWDGEEFVAVYSVGKTVNILILDDLSGSWALAYSGDPKLPVDLGSNFKLARDEGENGITALALVWSGIDMDDGGAAESVIYAAKLSGSIADGIRITAIMNMAKAPQGLVTASFDPYLSGNSIKAAVVYANESNEGCIVIEESMFENSIEVLYVSYSREEVFPDNELPVSFTLYNNGYSGIDSISIMLGGRPTDYTLSSALLPNESITVTVWYPVSETAGTAVYNITAVFDDTSSDTLTGSIDLRQTDTGIVALSFDDEGGASQLLVNLFNASRLTPPAGSSVKVGIYKDPLGIEPAGGSFTASDWATTAESGVVVPLTCSSQSETTMLYAVAKTYDTDGKEIYDTNILNNSIAFTVSAQPVYSGGGDSYYSPPETEPSKPPETTYENPFKDIKNTDWFYDAVMFAYARGLMVGVAPDVFSPNTQITRAMAVTVLYRMAALQGSGVRVQGSGDETANEEAPFAHEGGGAERRGLFTDVVADSWYSDAVLWAASVGIVQGYGNGRFGPQDNITREQMVTILYNYCKWKGIDVSVGEDTNILSYNDAFEISEWAIPAFQWACGAGIIFGKPGGYLDPKGSATRAEFATVLMRFIEAT